MIADQLKRILRDNEAESSTLVGNLLSAAHGKEIKTILVTSSRPGEGKTTCAVAIAHSLTDLAHARVLLVDGNLRNPMLHHLFEVTAAPGLTDLLLGQTDEGSAIRATEFERLKLMPYGSGGVLSPDVIKSSALSERWASLKGLFDYIVYDSDSVLTSSETAMVARHFDGAILVAECKKTKREVLRLAEEKLLNVGGNVLGVMLNKRRYYIPRGLYAKV